MFDRVARRYDLANHLLSFGRDFFWRRRAAEIVAAWNPACVLDLATGSCSIFLCRQSRSFTSFIDFTCAKFYLSLLQSLRVKKKPTSISALLSRNSPAAVRCAI